MEVRDQNIRKRMPSSFLPPASLIDQLNGQPQQARDHPTPDPDPSPPPIISFAGARSEPDSRGAQLTPSPPEASPSPPPPPPLPQANGRVAQGRYRECLRNHAASKGGHVVDGCGEFMPGGEDGTAEAFLCAACSCHRNFHRREAEGEPQPSGPSSSFYPPSSYNPTHRHNTRRNLNALVLPTPPPQPPYHFGHRHPTPHAPLSASPSAVSVPPVMVAFCGAAAESSSEDLGQPAAAAKKRHRTKFSLEQKERMTDFAERLDWRIQKQDEEQVQQFCAEIGVKRQVFKVWMHNNKQALRRKQL